MFKMLGLVIALHSTEKSYRLPFKDTSLELLATNLLHILPKQNLAGKLTFLLSALNL